MGEPGPSHPSADSRLEQVLADYSSRRAAGESVSLDDLLSRHPQLADALRSHFAADDAAGQTPVPAESDTATSVPTTDHGTEYRPRSSQATIPPGAFTPVRSCSLPEQFGRYHVVRCLGQGTMGAVYLADDTQLERPVALKIPKFTDDDDAEMTARFYREARAAAHLRHANLCPVYDVGEIDGIRYLSMAYIEGRPLSDLLSQDGPLNGQAAATFVLKLARALEVAHGRGVIHRDLKPANIMIDAHQEPIIMDFGLARRLNKEDSRLTQDGMLMGSPAYMSPEQVEGDIERMGPCCDIYSLGIILYELLTGEVPFKGSIAAVMGQIIGSTPRRPSKVKPGIDPALEAICLKMIAKRPEDRFPTMADVVRALDAYTAGRPTGVAMPVPDRTATMPALDALAPPSRGIVIAPWMLVTAVVTVVLGFGVTWGLITTMMRQQAGADEIKVNPQTRSALETGKAKAVINNQELSDDQLKQPIELQPGKNTLAVREGDSGTATIGMIEVTPGDDQKSYAVYDKDKGFVRKRSHRLLAEWALTHSGRVKLVGRDEFLEAIEDLPQNKDLPENKLQIAELDLASVKSVSPERLSAIAEMASLKRLILPKSVSKKWRAELRTVLPQCTIEPAE